MRLRLRLSLLGKCERSAQNDDQQWVILPSSVICWCFLVFVWKRIYTTVNVKNLLDDMTTRWTRSLPQGAAAGWCIKYSKPDLILRLFSLLHPELCEHFVQLRVETAWCWSLTPVLQWHSLHFMFPAGSLLTEQFCYVQLQSVTNVHSGQTTWDDLVFRSVPDTHSQWWQNNVSSSFQN